MAQKIDRKQLKQPDEFVSFTQKAVEMVIERRTGIIVGAISLTLVIVAFYAIRWYQENSEKKASVAFFKAKEIIEKPVITTQADPGLTEGGFSSEEEKYKAAIAEFEKVIKDHDGTQTASMAKYFLGECNRAIGQFDKAISILKEYLSKEGTDALFAPLAVEGIASSLESEGKDEDALAEYRKLTLPPFDSEVDRGMYHLARMEQKKGNLQEASRMFNEILKKYPKTIFRQEIQDRLSRLPSVETPLEQKPGDNDVKDPEKKADTAKAQES